MSDSNLKSAKAKRRVGRPAAHGPVLKEIRNIRFRVVIPNYMIST